MGAPPGPPTQNGVGPPQVAPGTGTKLSGTVTLAGGSPQRIRMEFVELKGGADRGMPLRILTLDGSGPWEVELPKNAGHLTILARVETSAGGPPTVVPVGETAIDVGSEPIWGIAVTIPAKVSTEGQTEPTCPNHAALLETPQGYAANPAWLTSHPYAMIRVEAGSFEMAAASGASHQNPDETPHEVRIDHPFLMGTYEVTQGLFEAVIGRDPSGFNSCGESCPVEMVSWCDIVAFANLYSRWAGLEPAYAVPDGFKAGMGWKACNARAPQVKWDDTANGYRMPTEAEWEYAARAGQDLPYAGSRDLGEVAWYIDNSGNQPHPVGLKKPNAWGLYDMSGNVWEWVWDWYGDYGAAGATDPKGPDTGTLRMCRGGGWGNPDWIPRVANRGTDEPGWYFFYQGFRLARNVD